MHAQRGVPCHVPYMISAMQCGMASLIASERRGRMQESLALQSDTAETLEEAKPTHGAQSEAMHEHTEHGEAKRQGEATHEHMEHGEAKRREAHTMSWNME